MDCRYFKEHIADMFDVGTKPDDKLIQHLKGCPECKAYFMGVA